MEDSIFRNRKRNGILMSVIAVILLLALALYFIPLPSRVQLTLNATKIDGEGKELGTVQIVMAGYKFDYLFQPDRLDVFIHGFENYAWMKPSDYYHNGMPITGAITGAILKLNLPEEYKDREPEWMYSYYGGPYANGDRAFSATLAFSPDLDRWLIFNTSDQIYYVASVRENDTVADLITYFHQIIH